jgi:putative addiction module component (TIGR02574 family)
MTQYPSIVDAALGLTDKERARLALHLIESLDPYEPEADVSAAWHTEAQRRLDDLRAGRVESVPSADVHAAIEARLRSIRG